MLQRSSPRPAVPGSPQRRRAVLPSPPPPQVGPGPACSPPAAGRARLGWAGYGGRARWLRGRCCCCCLPVPPRAWGWPSWRCHKAGAAPPSPPRWKTGRAAATGHSPTLRRHLHRGSPGAGELCSALRGRKAQLKFVKQNCKGGRTPRWALMSSVPRLWPVSVPQVRGIHRNATAKALTRERRWEKGHGELHLWIIIAETPSERA